MITESVKKVQKIVVTFAVIIQILSTPIGFALVTQSDLSFSELCSSKPGCESPRRALLCAETLRDSLVESLRGQLGPERVKEKVEWRSETE